MIETDITLGEDVLNTSWSHKIPSTSLISYYFIYINIGHSFPVPEVNIGLKYVQVVTEEGHLYNE